MKVYVKIWCPWCVEAIAWLRERGYPIEVIDVLEDSTAYQHMQQISGQTRTPTLETEDGLVLADFDVGQLEKFLRSHSINP